MSDKTDNIFMTFHNKPRARALFKPADERDSEDNQRIREEYDFELIIEKLRNQPGSGSSIFIRVRAGLCSCGLAATNCAVFMIKIYGDAIQ